MNSPREEQLPIKLLERINFAKHFHTKCPVHDVTVDDVRADMCRACDWTFPKLSQDTFILGNIPGYVKQKKETAHDI